MTARADLECILIADDVTGACDTGVQFARHGLSSEVWLDPTHVPSTLAQVVALNTDSRCDDVTAAKAKIQQIAGLYSDIKPGIILKKIDSTLRGNVGQEIAATMRYFRRDCAIILLPFRRWAELQEMEYSSGRIVPEPVALILGSYSNNRASLPSGLS
jgi:uncharacterized protein YgbK (DUF1537 family)